MEPTSAKIREYLMVGGLINPEFMEHDKVRDLLIECCEKIDKYYSMKVLSENKIVLCKAGSCCPTVLKDETGEQFTITDDFGGKVSLTKDELAMLKDAITHFSSQA